MPDQIGIPKIPTREEIIRQIYKEELEREPDSAGLAHYLTGYSANMTPEDIRRDLQNSAERADIDRKHILQTNKEQWKKTEVPKIQELFKAVIGREATAQELNAFAPTNQYTQGTSLRNIEVGLRKSDEYLTRAINNAFNDTLLRNPTEEERNTYLNLLKSGRTTEQYMRSNLSGDPETKDIVPYRKLINEWYAGKPTTPKPFEFTSEQEAFEKKGVEQEFRPFYQEQIGQSNRDFQLALQNARQGYSRRGLWGAAQPGVTGPVSGTRQVGEQQIETRRGEAETAFERAYGTAVAQGVQGRRGQAEDVWQKTIRDPYEIQYREWEKRLPQMQAGQKNY